MESDPGPWYIAKIRDVMGQEIIVVHTFAEHYVFIYSVIKPEEKWSMSELIGPFGRRADAEKFSKLIQCCPTEEACTEFKVGHWKFSEIMNIPEYEVLSLKKIKSLH